MELPFNISTHVFVFILSFAFSLVLGPILIPMLTRLKFGQTVRDDGPKSHYKKTGTPTMGGMIFLIPVVVLAAFYAGHDKRILPLIFVTLGFGLIGFIDDFIKVVKKRKDGLYWNQKMLGLLLIAVTFAIYVSKTQISDIIIPFLGMEKTVSLGWLFVPFVVLVLIASTNAVNITDGLDGLAAGVTLIITVFFTIVAMTRGEWEYIKIFSSIVAGGCLGFLAFNTYPAKVFMGDTGSLALGGAVGAIAILLKMPLILFIVGGIYVVEALSVMIQVLSFKLTGKRVFKMAPIHHHFELSGWREVKVVWVFWGITMLLCIIGFFALRLRFY
ncbi:phospho-N-acetylmuramoyl-pentapeptide-transferase [Acetivibrio mesophilus]|uniref:Phospho-N-acetylmuramoyl-pentapeptide-transferase n=1 Tax=Acetivibrio mesophilus TaxID=2487273 RepID=A0A4Q0I638_9FIRM|nr:phospho-N-acetylmuramoyl-pentapeptide-transferase [Acetivibrio mesophilus]ODM25180.1 phospho-N-acetylmuramoyl-pentapeptide-transferase [Clostridium sp. Bc-iso-3]RXE59801.1 phospho-N-acetylmuramoyl-pentapeptide-transferase [Acetivibrio mesophilus]HHV29582.1 phospho-N-acetylmuramoyl-pentapeptide-transferase [Clostridium sp.]